MKNSWNLHKTIITGITIICLILLITRLARARDLSRQFSWTYLNYLRVEEAIMKYQNIAFNGGWQPIPDGPVLKIGDRSQRVLALRLRLLASGDLTKEPENGDPYVFDSEVKKGVINFQKRHGLVPDGEVGLKTLRELNVPVEKKIKQLRINQKRILQMPEVPGRIFILVNIPEYALHVIENGEKIISMKAIVGREDRPTPIFNDEITYMVFNPSWRIPENIALNDILPKIRQDPDYLSKKGIRVLKGWGDIVLELNPVTINWEEITREKFLFRFEQVPGPDNPLGLVKFMFPNQHNVYIHDTPDKNLFSENIRAFSSGCIRIERPLELAEYLLQNFSELPANQVNEMIIETLAYQQQKNIKLSRPVPVYIVYWTAWVNADGKVNFRRDIYNKDDS